MSLLRPAVLCREAGKLGGAGVHFRLLTTHYSLPATPVAAVARAASGQVTGDSSQRSTPEVIATKRHPPSPGLWRARQEFTENGMGFLFVGFCAFSWQSCPGSESYTEARN